ncbi:MAG: ABC transporter ATP-binding protein [Planctomycetaceae bacterium]
MLQAISVTKRYVGPGGDLTVLNGIDLSVADGHRLVGMGASGSGKSTLLAILGTLETPTSGRIALDGEDVWSESAEIDPASRARFRNQKIGFIFQEHYLLGGCTAVDNVLLPVLATRSVDADALCRAELLLDRVGLSQRMRHAPSQLSGGERQRVAVARSLIMRPRLVLADEPTGQLDAASGMAVADLLVDLTADAGAMLIVVTHSEGLARRLCADGRGRVARLVEGRLEQA